MVWHLPLSGDTVTLADGDDVFVAQQVFLNQRIVPFGTGHEIVVAGTVSTAAAYPIFFAPGASGSVRVESTGQVRAFGAAAVLFQSGGQELINQGLIRAESTEGLVFGIDINTTGNADTTRIVNTGTIFGSDAGIWTHSPALPTPMIVIVQNSGTVEASGGGFSYLNEIGVVDDRITNSGVMIGDISLGLGNDRYDGRLGKVDGRVLGGDGNDSILGGAASDDLRGGAGNDTLKGGGGNDTLNGGFGVDEMHGGAGNDTYIVNLSNDEVVEGKNAGTDTVRSTASFTLPANVENLVLTGSANINGTGNDLANRITGNSGENILNGRGGKDILTGGGDSDVFRFNTALGADNVDTVTDFKANEDHIQLDDAIFAAVGASLTASEFVANASGTAQNALQHILYDTTDGRLFYDPDGNGAQARVHFATLKAGLSLDHLDFLVI
jgi:Ca2+-binding RTX toxin-like protein